MEAVDHSRIMDIRRARAGQYRRTSSDVDSLAEGRKRMGQYRRYTEEGFHWFEERIEERNRALEEKDEQLAALQQTIAAQAQAIAELNQQLAEAVTEVLPPADDLQM